MPVNPSRVQYFHLVRPVPKKSMPKLAYQLDYLEERKFAMFEDPETLTALITAEHIRGAVLRIPGQHPVDTRWSCEDPDYAFRLVLQTDAPYSQDEMRAYDNPKTADVFEVEHNT